MSSVTPDLSLTFSRQPHADRDFSPYFDPYQYDLQIQTTEVPDSPGVTCDRAYTLPFIRLSIRPRIHAIYVPMPSGASHTRSADPSYTTTEFASTAFSCAIAHTGAFWEIVSGGEFCHITDGGRCVSDGEGDYENDEYCTIKTLQPFVASATVFNTESGYDFLAIDGRQYHGTYFPQSLEIAQNTQFVWSSDGSVTGTGFKLCVDDTGFL